MHVAEVRLTNLKGCRDETVVRLSAFSALVGRNDAGKSTVFLALDCFLNEKKPTPDHCNASSRNSTIVVEVAFEPRMRVIHIDDAAETSFEDEELVDEGGLIRIRKTWDTGSSSKKPTVEIRRKSYGAQEFLFSNERDLIRQCDDLGIATRKANDDQFNNVEKRRKLREYHAQVGSSAEWIWTVLKTTGTGRDNRILKEFDAGCPRLEYFRADTSLSESDTSIQNYFRNHATSALERHGVDDVERQVRDEIQVVLDDVSERINRALPDSDRIRARMEFDWSKVTKLTFTTSGGDDSVPLELRGDGFRRVTMMAYFEHLAEKSADSDKAVIYAFEEPETFLHPTAQAQLLDKLRSMSEAGLQVLLSSHAPVLISGVPTRSIVHVVREDGKTSYRDGLDEVRSVVSDLGISPSHDFIRLYESATVLLLVEGPDDVSALRHAETLYLQAGHITGGFQALGVVFLPVGGCDSISWWTSLGLLAELGKPYFVFMDSDRQSSTGVSPNKEALEALGLIEGQNFYVSEKRELENYIPDDALSRISGCAVTYGDFDDVKEICKAHPDAGTLGGKRVARRYFTKMALEDLRNSYRLGDGADEFERLWGAVARLAER